MITRQQVSEKIVAYLNGELTLAQLVSWAENCMVEGGFAPDSDVDMLIEIVMYLAAADTKYFPPTWEVFSDFLNQLGSRVKVVPVGADE
jgi:hypothetical protein